MTVNMQGCKEVGLHHIFPNLSGFQIPMKSENMKTLTSRSNALPLKQVYEEYSRCEGSFISTFAVFYSLNFSTSDPYPPHDSRRSVTFYFH